MLTKSLLFSVILSLPLITSIQLPQLARYVFIPDSAKTLPGLTKEEAIPQKGIDETDRIGRIGIAALFYRNSTYTDGRYNHNDFPVELGIVQKSGSTERFDAYRFSPPQKRATKFLGSKHGLFYRFPNREKSRVYRLDGQKITVQAEIGADSIDTGGYTRLDGLTVSDIKAPRTYFFAPATARISPYHPLANGVEGAKLGVTGIGELLELRYPVEGELFDEDKKHGSIRRQLFLLTPDEKRSIGVVWQDKKSLDIRLTRIDSVLTGQTTITLPSNAGEILLAACSDPDGNIYYMTGRGGKKESAVLTMRKCDRNGAIVASNTPGTAKNELNIYDFGSYAADLAWSNGQLCMMLGRTMHLSPDGLNHQGGIAVLFSAADLRQLRNFGQTSGHSFDNILTVDRKGDFIGLDLGDNYPRGVHLHRLTEKLSGARVVFTFKTEHGTKPGYTERFNHPPYPEISGNGKSYYKWSNDNRTYSELGGVVDAGDGYTVLFTGEPGPDGRSLDNSRAGSPSPDPRNIGLVKVVPDFASRMANNPDDFTRLFLSPGKPEEGGFYSFGGAWSRQRNAGVVWLTDYPTGKDSPSARHLRVAALADNTILLLWESWSGQKWNGTWGMRIESSGKILVPPQELGKGLRIQRRNNILVSGNDVYIVSADKKSGHLQLFLLRPLSPSQQ